MSAKTGLSSGAGTCPKCDRLTGNVARHAGACRGKPAPIVITAAEQAAIDRAACHAVAADLLQPEARLDCGVDDLDVARLIRALEAGVEVVQGGRGWVSAVRPSPLTQAGLTTIVAEALRVGLVSAVSETTGPGVRKLWIVPAIVHRRPYAGAVVPPCKPHLAPGAKRYRMIADRALVDCLPCLDQPS